MESCPLWWRGEFPPDFGLYVTIRLKTRGPQIIVLSTKIHHFPEALGVFYNFEIHSYQAICCISTSHHSLSTTPPQAETSGPVNEQFIC